PTTLAEPRRRSINQSFLHLHHQHTLFLSTSRASTRSPPSSSPTSSSPPRTHRISFTDASVVFQQLNIQDFDRLNAQEIIRLCLYVAKRSPLDFADPITCECVHTEGERSKHSSQSRSNDDSKETSAVLSAADIYLSQHMNIGQCVLDNAAYPLSRSAQSLLTMAIFCARASGLQLPAHLNPENGASDLTSDYRTTKFSSAHHTETSSSVTTVSEASVSGARWLAKLGQVMFGGPCSHAGHSHHRRTRAKLGVLERQNMELGRTILTEGQDYPPLQNKLWKRTSVSSFASSMRLPSSGASSSPQQRQDEYQQQLSDKWCQHCSRAMACLVVASVKESSVQNGSKLEEALLQATGGDSETSSLSEAHGPLSPEDEDNALSESFDFSSSGSRRPFSVSASVSASSPPQNHKVLLPKFFFGRKRPTSVQNGLNSGKVELADRIASPMPQVDQFRTMFPPQEDEMLESAQCGSSPQTAMPHPIPITVARGRSSQAILEMDLAEAASTPSPGPSFMSPHDPTDPLRKVEEEEDDDDEDSIVKDHDSPMVGMEVLDPDTTDPLSASTHVNTRSHTSSMPTLFQIARAQSISVSSHNPTQKPALTRGYSEKLKGAERGPEDKGVLGAMGIYHPLHALGLHTPGTTDSFVREVEESFRKLSSGSLTAEGWFQSHDSDQSKEEEEEAKDNQGQQQQPRRSPNIYAQPLNLEKKKGSDSGIEGGVQADTDTEGHPPAAAPAIVSDAHKPSEIHTCAKEDSGQDQSLIRIMNSKNIVGLATRDEKEEEEEEEGGEEEEEEEEEKAPSPAFPSSESQDVMMGKDFAETTTTSLNQENGMVRGAAAMPDTTAKPLVQVDELKRDYVERTEAVEEQEEKEEEEEVKDGLTNRNVQESTQSKVPNSGDGVAQEKGEDKERDMLNEEPEQEQPVKPSSLPTFRPVPLTISTSHPALSSRMGTSVGLASTLIGNDCGSGNSSSEEGSEANDDHDSDYSQGSTIESPITPTDMDLFSFSQGEDQLEGHDGSGRYDRRDSGDSVSMPKRHRKRLLVDDAKRKQEQLERIKAQLELRTLGKIRRQISFWEERGVLEQKVVAVVDVDETEENGPAAQHQQDWKQEQL
ncbi:hypothetical protein BGW38_003990, partial [Lunasporangiospora selenospora]